MHPATLKTDWMLATTLRHLNQLDASEELMRSTLERQRVVLGDEHNDTIKTWNSLAGIASRRGRPAEAAAIFEQVLSTAKPALGLEHRTTLAAMTNLAWMYMQLDRLGEAESMLRDVVEMKGRVYGEEHPSTLQSMHVLGVTLRKQGRLGEAEQVLGEAVEQLSRVMDEDNLLRIAATGDLASVYLAQERYAEAEAGLRKNYESYRDAFGEDHPRTVWALHRVALAVARRGRLAEAERMELKILADHRRVTARPYLRELIEIRERLAATPDASTSAKMAYARLLLECEPTDLRDPRTALRVAREAVEVSESPPAALLGTLALAHHRNGDARQAVEYQRRAIEALPAGRAETRRSFEAQLERYESQLAGGDS
jgi:tetratricopeptide (TPR) repeat protein